ncbi:hypothetical protein [Actinosynnema sp. NPDC020468]
MARSAEAHAAVQAVEGERPVLRALTPRDPETRAARQAIKG